MRISDWSSDVCSSDLRPKAPAERPGVPARPPPRPTGDDRWDGARSSCGAPRSAKLPQPIQSGAAQVLVPQLLALGKARIEQGIQVRHGDGRGSHDLLHDGAKIRHDYLRRRYRQNEVRGKKWFVGLNHCGSGNIQKTKNIQLNSND